jgi:hypothetical protein
MYANTAMTICKTSMGFHQHTAETSMEYHKKCSNIAPSLWHCKAYRKKQNTVELGTVSCYQVLSLSLSRPRRRHLLMAAAPSLAPSSQVHMADQGRTGRGQPGYDPKTDPKRKAKSKDPAMDDLDLDDVSAIEPSNLSLTHTKLSS